MTLRDAGRLTEPRSRCSTSWRLPTPKKSENRTRSWSSVCPHVSACAWVEQQTLGGAAPQEKTIPMSVLEVCRSLHKSFPGEFETSPCIASSYSRFLPVNHAVRRRDLHLLSIRKTGKRERAFSQRVLVGAVELRAVWFIFRLLSVRLVERVKVFLERTQSPYRTGPIL